MLFTGGRWLHRDAERRAAHFLKFDFKALMQEAIGCCQSAQRVVDCIKVEMVTASACKSLWIMKQELSLAYHIKFLGRLGLLLIQGCDT